nr:MAG TPA: Head Tail Connector Protein [Caudoviricetes sp.]
MATVCEELLADIKTALDVTWDDPGTDRKLRTLTASGMVYLDSKLGETADYMADGLPRTLLLEYVRYARDGALDLFEGNYRAMILAMQQGKAVERYAEQAADETKQ